MSIQNVSVYAGTTRTCVSTCARGAGTHGDVLDGHTPHTTPQQHDHNTTRKTEREREREREKEDRDRERREDEREEDKIREKIHFQCGGAWPFFVDGVLCLVHPVNDLVFSLLNKVKYDCSLISFSASWQVDFFFEKICELLILCSYSFLLF